MTAEKAKEILDLVDEVEDDELRDRLKTDFNEVLEEANQMEQLLDEAQDIMYGMCVVTTISGYEDELVPFEDVIEHLELCKSHVDHEYIESTETVLEMVKKASRSDPDNMEDFIESCVNLLHNWKVYKESVNDE